MLRYTVPMRYPLVMGQKTSVYLADDVAAKAKASGIPLGELVRRGLEAGEPESLEAVAGRLEAAMRQAVEAVQEEVRRAVREELAARFGPPAGSDHAMAETTPESTR